MVLFLWILCALLDLVSCRIHTWHRFDSIPVETIVVDRSGSGNFTKIQDAIDAIPSNYGRWICISIKQGTYREKVFIPSDKPFIYLKGESKRTTMIVWNDYGSVATSATFTSEADSIVAKSITFVNSYNYPLSKNAYRQVALAARIAGDKSMFYRCGFIGLQDTLWDMNGRHYYKLCTIQGAVDFIFGSGQSFFERCTLIVTGGALNGYIGYITAQGRMSPAESNGFVFMACSIVGDGKVYLGRPWRDYARVLFVDTSMADVIVPQGWDAWYTKGHEDRLSFMEFGCSGPGANSNSRVKWANRFSKAQMQQFLSTAYIDDLDGWVSTYCQLTGCNAQASEAQHFWSKKSLVIT